MKWIGRAAQLLIFMGYWLYMSSIFEELINDTLVWGDSGVSIPPSYVSAVYFLLPACVLTLIGYRWLKVELNPVQNATTILLMVVLLADWHYLIFVLPGRVAQEALNALPPNARSKFHQLSWTDVLPLMFWNLIAFSLIMIIRRQLARLSQRSTGLAPIMWTVS